LRDRVPEAVGFVPPSEVGAYYERAAVVCVPSRREGYGMTAREAMAHGRPVVATRVGGLADLTAGVVLVAPGDAAALRRELKSLLDDAGLRQRSGDDALALARREFSLEASASALVAAYTAAVTAPVPTCKPKAA
jgi:glycosyltransferase involved in cell wall biosynthesis